MKYGKLDLTTIESVVNKLGGMDGVKSFLREDVILSYKDGRRLWNVWKSIEVGYVRDKENLIKTLSFNKINFESVESLLKSSSFEFYKRGRQFCLVQVSLKDLGLDGTATWQKILERAEKLGLSICPPEVGPKLRLQYKDQKECEVLIIGMHGLIDPDFENRYHVFVVWANPLTDVSRYEDGTFVFVLGSIE